LCHGLLNALRCCVEDCKSHGIFEVVGSELGGKSPGRDTTHFWKPLFDQIAKLSLKSLHTAMIVIAEASTDIPFAPVLSVDSNAGATSSSVMSARGPVNTTTCLSASYVNANSNIGISDGENSKVQDVNIQRSVVGAWLLVREATAMLAKLVSISPPPSSSEVMFDESHPRSPCQVLSSETISSIGYSIVDALGRLKHMGAIAETQASLQTIAEALLRFVLYLYLYLYMYIRHMRFLFFYHVYFIDFIVSFFSDLVRDHRFCADFQECGLRVFSID